MTRRSQTSSLLRKERDTPDILVNNSFNPAFFRHIAQVYRERTGFHLVYSDLSGCIQMGLPDCDKFPCMRSCKDCRESIIREAIRTGKVCLDRCHEGFIIWGLPVAAKGEIVGGFVVIGVNDKNVEVGNAFRKGCVALYTLMKEFDVLPDESFTGDLNLEEIIRYVHRENFSLLNIRIQEIYRNYLDSLQTADFEEAKGSFEQIRDIFNSHKELPLDLLKGFAADFLFQAQQRFINGGFDSYVCMSETGALVDNVSSVKTVDEFEDVMHLICRRFTRLAKQATKDQDLLLIEKVIAYLEANIRERLTREIVAQGVGVSPSHLSRLLRKKKDRTFTDLLNQYRIERACKLLVRSSKSLAEVANETGFCDQSYFSKVFRNYKEVTPAEYRLEHVLQ